MKAAIGILVMLPAIASAQPKHWRLIGERTVDSAFDKDALDLDGRGGSFTQIRLVDAEMDAEIVGIVVTFDNGDVYVPDVHERQLGIGETVTFTLPADARPIQSIRIDSAVIGEAFGMGPWGRFRVYAR